MSTTIDQKVVEMRFDNEGFEKNVSQSISSIDKLKASLNFSGLSSSIGNIEQSVGFIASKFTALGVVATTTLVNIAQQAIQTGATMIQSLTIDQIAAGFEKYNNMIVSTQTIMSATRKEWANQYQQMSYVNDQLDRLLWFTDETSYNFVDMVDTIGKFTAAGVDLDRSVTSMMGIATWAGLSGQNAAAASRAMYNLAQSLAMGGVRVQDWMSIETANMATEEFKQTVIETAVELGKLTRVFYDDGTSGVYYTGKLDEMQDATEGVLVTTENFRTTLAEKWFDNDVLNATLDKYGAFAVQLERSLARINETTDEELYTTELIDYIEKYKEAETMLAKSAGWLGINQSLLRGYIRDYNNGVLDVEAIAEQYNLTVEGLTEELDKYSGGLFELSEITDEYGGDISVLYAEMGKLSDSQYDLGLAALKASQESRTFADAINYCKDAVSSGWMTTFDLIIGNLLEAKEVFKVVSNELYDVFVKDGEERNAILEEWVTLGGRTALLEAVMTIWNSIKDSIFAVKDGIHDIFPQKTAEELVTATEKFRDFVDSIKLTDTMAESLRNTAANIANVFRLIWYNVKEVAHQVKRAWETIFPPKTLEDGMSAIENITKKFSDFAEKHKLTFVQAAKLKRTLAGLFAILDIIGQLLKAIIEPILGKLGVATDNLGDGILDVTYKWGDWLVALDKTIREKDVFGNAINAIIDFFGKLKKKIEDTIYSITGMTIPELWDEITKSVKNAGTEIKNFFSSLTGTEADDAEEKSFNLATIFETIKKWIDDAKKAWEEAKPYFDELIKAIEESVDVEALGFDNIQDLYKRMGGLAVLFIIFQTIYDAIENLQWFFTDGIMMFRNFFANLNLIIEGFGETMWSLQKRIKAGIISKIARALLYVAIAITLISLIKTEKLEDAVAVIVGALLGLVYAMNMLINMTNGVDTSKVWIIGKTMRSLAFALIEVALALAIIGKSFDKSEDLQDAVIALGALLAVITGIIYLLGNSSISGSKMNGMASAFSIIGFALIEIAAALSILMAVASQTDNLMDAVVALAAMVAVIGLFYAGMNEIGANAAMLIAVSAAMVIAGLALIEFGAALSVIMMFADNSAEIIAATVALSVLVLAMGLFFAAMSSPEMNPVKIMAAAAALTLAGIGLMEMAVAIAIVAQVANNEEFVNGVAALIAMLAVLVVALVALSEFGGGSGKLLAASAAIAIASVGLIAMAYALSLLTAVDDIDVVLTMGIALGVLIGAAILAEKVIYGLLALGAALLMIGLGGLAAGEGMLKFAEGIERIVAGGKEGVDIIKYFMEQCSDILPNMLANLAQGIANFANVLLIGNSELVIEALGNLFVAILEAIKIALPVLLDILEMLFDDAINMIYKKVPIIIEVIAFVTRAILGSMMDLTPDITAAAMYILLDTLKQIAENIGEITMYLVQILLETIFGTIDGITAELPHIIDSIWEFWIALINSFADGLDEHSHEMKEALIHLGEALWEAICDFFGIHSPSTKFFDMAVNMIQGMIDGLASMIEKAKEAITDLADKVLTKICDFFGIKKPESQQELLLLGKKIIDNFITGINSMIEKAKAKIQELADKVLTKICDFFGVKKPENQNEFMNLGKTIIQKFNAGIYGMIEKAKSMITEFASRVLNAVCSFFGVETPGNVGELYDIAKQVIDGFIQGIYDKVNSAVYAVGSFCNDVIDKCKSVFDVNSPSRVFAEIGRFVDMGFAQGVLDNADVAVDASEEMANAAIDSVAYAISHMSDLVNDEIDSDPVIRPVLDLSDVVDGAQSINGLLASNRTIGLAANSSADINNNILARNSSASALDNLTATLSGLTGGNTTTQNNTFNISGSNPKEIADEINKILNEQMVREDSVWA